MSSAPLATRRQWIGLAVIALPCLLVAMDMTVLNLALPRLSADLKPTNNQLLWIVDTYGFLIAGSLLTMGTLGDRIGRRRLLLMGATAFGAASICAAFAKSAEMLIAMRGLLGVAGATLAPSTLSLIRNMFLDDKQRTVAISIWMTSFSLGGLIGPLVGGALLEHFWWGSVFLINVPVMLLLLVLGPLLLPEFKDPNPGHVDFPSAALSLTAVLSVIYGLKSMAEHGASRGAVVAIVVGISLAVIFLRRQRHLSYPFVDIALFARREFGTALTMNTLVVIAMFGLYFLTAQYLQLVLRLTPLQAGLVSIPTSLAFVVGNALVPMLSRRFRPPYLIGGGLLLSVPGFLMLTQLGVDTGVAFAVAGPAYYHLMLSPVFTLSTAIVVGTAPPERAGAAAGLSETSFELGGALGVALLGTLGLVIYRTRLATMLAPGAPEALAHAARNTLADAVVEGAHYAPSIANLVLGPARDAFLCAVHSVAIVSACMVAVIGVTVLVLLRNVKL